MAATAASTLLGTKAPVFRLPATDAKTYALDDIAGLNGTVIAFICNHCPYVKAIIDRLVNDAKVLMAEGIGFAAICSNDAKSHPEDSFARGQGSDQAAKDLSRVIPVREAVHHPFRSLRPPVARVGAESSEGHKSPSFQLIRCGLHEQANFPMTGVVAERNWSTVRRANSALSAQNQELLPTQLGRAPPHSDVQAQSEKIAARAFQEHFFG